MRSQIMIALATVILALSAVPSFAHHSFAAGYDQNKTLTLTGRVVKFDWVNPHPWITIEVTGRDGTKALWEGQAKSVSVLSGGGWTRPMAEGMAKAGEVVTMRGYASKNGSLHLYALDLTRSDRKTVLILSGQPKILK